MANEIITIKDLAAGEAKAVKSLKMSVATIATRLGVVRESARDIAPRVVQLFNDLTQKYPNLGGFVGFARLFDPDMPLKAGTPEAPGYRQNKTYYALDYMRRLVRLRPRGQQGRRDPATDVIARTLATVLQVTKDPDPVWTAVAREFSLGDRTLARLKARVDDVKPIIDLSGVKQVMVTDKEIIHMSPAAKNPATATGSLATSDVVKAARGHRKGSRAA